MKQKNSIFNDKKAAIGIIIFFFAILAVLVLGFFMAIVWGVIDIASDEITPIMEGLGMVGDTNLSEAATYTFGVTDTFIQAMPGLIALTYVMALVFTLVFIFIVGYNPHPAFIGLYIALMFLLIIGCVIISNMYQDIMSGDDDLASRLKEQTALSFLILHSPVIMTVIAGFGGVIMFSMRSMSEGISPGGFGV